MFTCNCCNSSKSTNLIDLGKQPYANKYPTFSNFKNEIINDLLIDICLNCYTAFTKKFHLGG